MPANPEASLVSAAVEAIWTGDVESLQRMLRSQPALAKVRVDGSRTLLHVATDWPGHFPNGPAIVAALAEAGADPNAAFLGRHAETPLHWAASSNDVAVLDALLDAGADIEAPGSVINGGSPLSDARAFGQWAAAYRLVQRGAETTLTDAATLGLMDRVERSFAGNALPTQDEIDRAFWGACHGGQRRAAEYLLEHGANLNWVPPWENMTPIDAARRSEASELAAWLHARGARPASDTSEAKPSRWRV